MNTRTCLLACALSGLPLALLPALVRADPTPAAPSATAAQTDTPAVAVVRHFLADRAAGRYHAAYALLSGDAPQIIPQDWFLAGNPPPKAMLAQMAIPLQSLSILLYDTHNTLNRAFTVIGLDPTLPSAVLVRADPPGVVIHLVTVTDLVTHTLRIDPQMSLERTSPEDFAKAQRAASLSNLRQLALGVILYEQDHDKRMPDAAHWVDEIMPYVKTEAIFHDPSALASEKWSYAYNRALSHQPLAALDAPARTVLLFESNLGVRNASDAGQSAPRPGRHLGGTDYAFADGHAKWVPDGTKLSYRLDGK